MASRGTSTPGTGTAAQPHPPPSTSPTSSPPPPAPQTVSRSTAGPGAERTRAVSESRGNREQQQQQQQLSPLEHDVLEEYARLLGNLNHLSSTLANLSSAPTAEVLDGLRGLERKTSLVFTLLKASVYSIVLQQEIYAGGGQ